MVGKKITLFFVKRTNGDCEREAKKEKLPSTTLTTGNSILERNT